MKKTRVITLSALLAGSLFASGVYVQDGWNLKGADKNLNVSEVPCAKAIWVYDQHSNPEWKLYHKYTNSNNHGYPVLNSISQGQGFWVLGEGCSNNPPVDGNNTDGNMTTPATFHAFDKEWQNRRFFDKSKDERYLVNGNVINLHNPIVELVAKKKTNIDSRTEMKVASLKPVNMVEAKVNLKVSTSNYNRGQMNLLFDDVTIDSSLSDKTANITKAMVVVGTFVTNSKLFYWVTVEDNSGNVLWDTANMDTTIADNLSLVDKDVKLSVKVIPNGVKFDVVDDTNQTYTKEFTNAKIGLDMIDSVRFRARVDDVKANSNSVTSGNETVFKVLGVEIPDVSTKYDENATLPNFGFNNLPTTFINMMDSEEHGYDKVMVSGSTLKFQWVEKENGVWTPESGDDFNMTLSNQTTDMANYTTVQGETGKFKLESYKKVISVDGVDYNGSGNLYEIMALRTTEQVGAVEWEDSDWTPSRYNHSTKQDENITNIIDFITEAIKTDSGMWFNRAKNGGVNMLRGSNVSSGDVVRGIADGVHQGCTEGDCTKYVKTNEVIGSWQLNGGELKVDSNETFEYQYSRYTNGKFQQGWQSRAGSSEKHRFVFGDDSSNIGDIEKFVQDRMNDNKN